MTVSRNPLEYLKRKGQVPVSPDYRPRFSPCLLRIHSYPTGSTVQKAALAEGGGGAPDRAWFYPWPANITPVADG
jgi:hypothetical protein